MTKDLELGLCDWLDPREHRMAGYVERSWLIDIHIHIDVHLGNASFDLLCPFRSLYVPGAAHCLHWLLSSQLTPIDLDGRGISL